MALVSRRASPSDGFRAFSPSVAVL